MSGYKPDASTDAFIHKHGGVIHHTSDGRLVDFPDREPERDDERPFGGDPFEQIERAIARADAFGTTGVKLWREKGDGWMACTSHDQHPGYSYICQIDPITGQPLKCECDAVVVCHHLGRNIACWRQGVGWYDNEASVMAPWQETLDRITAGQAAERRQEEEW